MPVACKSCPCGHFFYNARRIAREFAIEADYRRRTARVRREKPNYYDALEYDKHIKKVISLTLFFIRNKYITLKFMFYANIKYFKYQKVSCCYW